jgi:hypothetical protein
MYVDVLSFVQDLDYLDESDEDDNWNLLPPTDMIQESILMLLDQYEVSGV